MLTIKILIGGGKLFFQLFSSQGGYIGVAIFFFLSGYGLMESELHAHMTSRQFFNKRLKRVIFPLLILAIIWYPLYYGLKLEPETMKTGGVEIILNILNVGGWFVSAILMMYIAFTIFTWFLHTYEIKYAIAILLLLTMLVYIACDRLLGYYTPLSIPIFTAGIFASLYKGRNYKFYNYSLVYLLLGMVVSVGYCIVFQNSMALATHSVLNYICIALLIILFTKFSPKIVFPVLLGEISFDIYLIHKRIITSYLIVTSELINIWIWIVATAIITGLFVAARRFAWNKILK